MKPIVSILPILALASLSACGTKGDSEHSATVSIDAKDVDSNVSIDADGSAGKVSVKIPGFDANVNLPKTMLDNSNFDLDGVKLYPGSKVVSVNVNSNERDGAGSTKVRVGFNAPADPAKVKAWFKSGFEKEGAAFTETATGFSGKTGDGDAFTMTLTPNGASATGGTIDITG